MRKLFFILFCISAGSFFIPSVLKAQCSIVPFSVIELFVSQGCSYCPSAEAGLSQEIAAEKNTGNNVICIAEHVTYFNTPWVDLFSDVLYTNRQKTYCQKAGVQQGTPEAFAGGNTIITPDPTYATISAAVSAELAQPASVGVCLTLQTPVSSPTLTLDYSLAGSYTGKNLVVVLVEDGLTTTPTSGENAGVTLHEDGVARKMIVLPITGATGTVSITPPSNCVRTKSQIVAYVQNPTTMVIYGATRGVDLSTATTGMNEQAQGITISIYPNPATTEIMLNGLSVPAHCHYSICNMLGEEVQSGKLNENATIGLSDISNGMYFLKVSDGDISFTGKLNKQ